MLALDVPVPQMVDQLVDIEQFSRALSPDPEQVIDVPKILPFDVPMRAAVRSAAGGTAGGSADDHFLFLVTVDWSSTSTFQFLVVEDQDLVFKVFPLDRVQQRRVPLRSAFLRGLWSRSLPLLQVEVFMVLSQDTVHLLLTPQGHDPHNEVHPCSGIDKHTSVTLGPHHHHRHTHTTTTKGSTRLTCVLNFFCAPRCRHVVAC